MQINKFRKNFFSTILIIILYFFFYSLSFNQVQAESVKPILQIPIPNINFSDVSDCGDNQICNNWLAQYIGGLYNYAIGIVGILAAVAMMVGGIMWLTAGGDVGRVGEGKAWIVASVTGLVIALASYTILYQINPDLLTLKKTSISKIQVYDVQIEIPELTPEFKSSINSVLPDVSGTGVLGRPFSELLNEPNFNSADAVKAFLKKARPNGPMAEVAQVIYDTCKAQGVPISFALGVFAQETQYNSDGALCARKNNPGCMFYNGSFMKFDTLAEGTIKAINNMGRWIKRGYNTPGILLEKWHPTQTPSPHQAANIARMPAYQKMVAQHFTLGGVITK